VVLIVVAADVEQEMVDADVDDTVLLEEPLDVDTLVLVLELAELEVVDAVEVEVLLEVDGELLLVSAK
jgi:hypothetical protein